MYYKYIYICVCVRVSIYMYIYYIKFEFLCFLFIVTFSNTYTHWSHWFHIHIIFTSCFYLIIVTSGNSQPNCKHDPSYQERSQSNLVKSFFVLHGELLTGFKHNFKNLTLKLFLKISQYLQGSTCVGVSF